MDQQTIEKILNGLISGDAEITKHMIDTYFTEDTVFLHPFYIMRGRESVYSVWRSTFALLLVRPSIKEYWARVGLCQGCTHDL